jgi:hypothetical protein
MQHCTLERHHFGFGVDAKSPCLSVGRRFAASTFSDGGHGSARAVGQSTSRPRQIFGVNEVSLNDVFVSDVEVFS